MLEHVNLDVIAAPIGEGSPAGENIRYTKVFDDIKEARREDEDIPQGDWQRERKSADWDKVVRLALDALSNQTKDFQVAAWLAEALAMENGFAGVESGLRVMQALLSQFWDTAFPLVEEEDYEFRAAPFEFLNDKLTAAIRSIPLTDPRTSPGYSFLKWKESRDVGYEAEARGGRREELLAEGKIPAEEFDAAVAKSSAAFYKALADAASASVDAFREVDAAVDEKFRDHAPRVSDIGKILDECHQLIVRICREQKGLRDAFATEPEAPVAGLSAEEERAVENPEEKSQPLSPGASLAFPGMSESSGVQETALWNEAVRLLQSGGLAAALNLLLGAAGSQASERGRSRYRFLVAKLCLKAARPDLAKPLLEQLYEMITELHLEKWESPTWIAEIMEALYQCLVSSEFAGEDPARAQELFRKICTMDVTKALSSRR